VPQSGCDELGASKVVEGLPPLDGGAPCDGALGSRSGLGLQGLGGLVDLRWLLQVAWWHLPAMVSWHRGGANSGGLRAVAVVMH
jgi:hypothetical protein